MTFKDHNNVHEIFSDKPLMGPRYEADGMPRLREVPEEIKDLVAEQKLSGSHVRTLLTLEDPKDIVMWAKKVVNEDISVHQLEKLLKAEKPQNKEKTEKKKDIFLENIENKMSEKLQTKVEVGKKKIVINYENNNDLNRILEILNCLEEEI